MRRGAAAVGAAMQGGGAPAERAGISVLSAAYRAWGNGTFGTSLVFLPGLRPRLEGTAVSAWATMHRAPRPRLSCRLLCAACIR